MNVAIHDGDCGATRFPNLALMKISAYHKRNGDTVEWFNALSKYDKVYSSKVFTFTPKDHYLPPDAVLGGTGYGMFGELSSDIEWSKPDYTLYPDFKPALGFITRGCIRQCPWCIVPKKEGVIRHDRHPVIILGRRRSAIFMDNNVLASEWALYYLQEIISTGATVDFNQGLDARIVSSAYAELLAKIRWIRYVRFSCDTPDMRERVAEAVGRIRGHGCKAEMFCYVLVNDVQDALETCEFLRGINVTPFAQAFRDYSGNDNRTQEQINFCRWVNRRKLFYSTRFEDYQTSRRSVKSETRFM